MGQTSQVGLPNIHAGSEESVEGAQERLGHRLTKLLVFLVSLGVMAIGGIAFALYEDSLQAEVRLLVLGACGGLLGSCVSAGISAAQRYSDGVETRDGRQYPGTERKPRFNDAMIPFFYLRPFLGAAMGVLAYAGLVAGLLFATGSTGSAGFAVRPESVLFAAGVAGLFAKTLIEKLKNSFDQIVGK
jgi:hypothetical protein